jgi:hypothetical protein
MDYGSRQMGGGFILAPPPGPNAAALHVVDTTNCRENFVCLGHIESFRGQNPVVQVDVWPHDQGHMVQMFLLSPEGRKLATLSEPMGR